MNLNVITTFRVLIIKNGKFANYLHWSKNS